MEVLRYRPEHSFQSPEVVASFKPTKFSYIHSFSITENYAVFLFYPVVIDPKKYPESNFHVFELFDGSNVTDTTDVFVVNLNNGDVKGGLEISQFSLSSLLTIVCRTLPLSLDLLCPPRQRLRVVPQ